VTDVALFFDFVSPYSWLALMQARPFAEQHAVRWQPRPVVYAKLLEHHGLVGPAETATKRRYTFHDVDRCARDLGLSVEGPPTHPFRSLEALRTATLFGDDPRALDLCVALADACWSEGRDLTDVAQLVRVVAEAGLDATRLSERIGGDEVRERLRRTTAEAVERGVFGVPAFVLGDELFWGHDRLGHLAARLEGRLGPSGDNVWRILDRPFGVRRRF